jgi:hypothetical protein
MITELIGFGYLLYQLTYSQQRPSSALLWVLFGFLVLVGFWVVFSVYHLTHLSRGFQHAVGQWHLVNHCYRNYLGNIIFKHLEPKDFVGEQRNHLHGICDALAKIFLDLTRVECRVSIKLMLSKGKCFTFVRNGLYDEAERLRGEEFSISRGVNTAFADALTETNKDEIKRFYCDDLRALADAGKYHNSRPNWRDRYQSAIVVPIQFQSNKADEKREHLGYLCVDTRSRNRLNDSYHVQILAAFADQIFNFLVLSQCLIVGAESAHKAPLQVANQSEK